MRNSLGPMRSMGLIAPWSTWYLPRNSPVRSIATTVASVDDVSFQLAAESDTALVGPNGAGGRSAAAQGLFDEGISHLTAGRIEVAVAKLREARRLAPTDSLILGALQRLAPWAARDGEPEPAGPDADRVAAIRDAVAVNASAATAATARAA